MLDIQYTDRGQAKIYSAIVASSFSVNNDERLVLLFVLQRTVGWRKQFATISMKEFETGVRRRDGVRRLIVGGTGLIADQIAQAIDGLCKMGALETAEIVGKTMYRIVEDWRHPDLATAGRYGIWSLNEDDYIYPDKDDEDE